MSNLLRLIHTVKPPKRKEKKKREKEISDTVKPPKRKEREKEISEAANTEPSNPIVKEKKKKFPGLSLPDNSERVKGLLKLEPQEEEELSKMGVEQGQEDPSVASQALNEVSDCVIWDQSECPD